MLRILTVVSFSALLAAQTICVSGVVQPVPGPTICMQGETHYLAGTQVYLRSSAVPLAQLVGQNVRLEGLDVGLVCRVIDVSAAAPASARLTYCGTPMPGCSLRFKVEPGAIGMYGLFGSLAPAFVPLGCAPPSSIDGTLLLDAPIHVFVVAFFPGPSGDYVWAIPNIPSVAGTQVWFQGARQDIGPVGPIEFTNAQRILIAPFMPPCGGINC